MSHKKLAVIVTTYNWPKALDRVLAGFNAQTDKNFVLYIADDGSRDDTRELISDWQARANFTIHHIWQEDDGFRAARIRNLAAKQSTEDYLIFTDGDCVPRANFISQHRRLIEKGYFVAGQRILLSKAFSENALTHQQAIGEYSNLKWFTHYLRKDINRFFALLTLPIQFMRKKRTQKWQGVKTCNFAVFREDFLAVNGFDENYAGWGYEDSDLVIRLLNHGVKRKDGFFATGLLHLWHKEQDRALAGANYQRLMDTLNEGKTWTEHGVTTS